MSATTTLALVLVGLCTYYDPATAGEGFYRSGEAVSKTDPTGIVAVDTSMWAELAGATLYVCTPSACGTYRVADSGYLYDAGRFRYDPERGYHRRSTDRRSSRVVLDFPREAFRHLSPDLETRRVVAWLVEGGGS